MRMGVVGSSPMFQFSDLCIMYDTVWWIRASALIVNCHLWIHLGQTLP